MATSTEIIIRDALKGNLVQVSPALYLSMGVNVDSKDTNGGTALFAASHGGHVAIVKELLSKKANVHIKTKDGGTALFVATYKGHLEVVKATALMYACKFNTDAHIAKVILDAGADMDAQDDNGLSSLMFV
jgi:ankyrin repeat protein